MSAKPGQEKGQQGQSTNEYGAVTEPALSGSNAFCLDRSNACGLTSPNRKNGEVARTRPDGTARGRASRIELAPCRPFAREDAAG